MDGPDGMAGAMSGFLMLLMLLIYGGFFVFFIWVCIAGIRALQRMADAQRATSEAMQEIARKIGPGQV